MGKISITIQRGGFGPFPQIWKEGVEFGLIFACLCLVIFDAVFDHSSRCKDTTISTHFQ